jgi:hypothetical protein
MLLNMLRVEDANPENLVRSSFLQFQIEKDAPGLELEVPAVLYYYCHPAGLLTGDVPLLVSCRLRSWIGRRPASRCRRRL